MKFKSSIMDEDAMRRSLVRITHEIIEKNSGTEDVVLLGIQRRGLPLAAMLQENIFRFEGKKIPLGRIDVSLYRDDLTELSDLPEAGQCEIPFDLNGKTVILVDDVIYTGRTVRAAIDAIFHHGRPRAIQLAVLIDRGHRELPIRPDYVGKNIPTSHSEVVSVMVKEFDGRIGVALYQLEEGK
ncbi:MAG: bifunctional pyr operon transcriptional regulator/uracil phosphoribosyltransferase PyrR [Clostridiales bacterium]|nr:bifunctional pyr operon transcriptional regulator/uracil phosphoribosyltransferase PyrR [Clostridiales bacterium]